MRLMMVAMIACSLAVNGRAAEPDYSQWNRLLAAFYDPGRGMDYAGLKARDRAALEKLKRQLSTVDAAVLSRPEQLAYWINVYNINTVATIVETYPVKSIRDISTDPIVRLNVFKKKRIPYAGGLLSLNDVENDKIRAFKDPRIHFAINCAALSCPPLRSEAYAGERLSAQLDDQARKFLNGPGGARFATEGDTLVIHVTKIMSWFGDDFENWGGGKAAFIRRHVPPDKQRLIDAAGRKIDFSYDSYDWSINDWAR